MIVNPAGRCTTSILSDRPENRVQDNDEGIRQIDVNNGFLATSSEIDDEQCLEGIRQIDKDGSFLEGIRCTTSTSSDQREQWVQDGRQSGRSVYHIGIVRSTRNHSTRR
ncbi:hypothetical protein CsSME_00011402 [Camellia sinensis var. sinensis]